MYLRGKGGVRDGSGAGAFSGYRGLGENGWFDEATQPGVAAPSGFDPSGFGKALKEALSRGDKVATKYVDQAKQFYADFVAKHGYSSTADLAQYFFLQGADVLTRGTEAAMSAGLLSSGTGQQVMQSTTALRDAVKAGISLGSGEGGSLDKVKDVDSLIKSTIQFADSVGANKDITSTIQQWASVAVGCATAMLGSGPMWGSIGCAAMALLNALSQKAPGATTTPSNVPLALLVLSPNIDPFRPEITQTTIVARDAMLLAQVLKHHYGLTSSRTLYNMLAWSGDAFSEGEPQTPEAADGAIQLWGRTVQVFKLFTGSPDESKPAVDLTSMLLAVGALDQTAPVSWSKTYSVLHEIARLVCTYDWDEACHCNWPFSWDPKGCGSYKLPAQEDLLSAHYYAAAGELNQAGIAIGATHGRGRIAAGLSPESWLPFIRVDELINFFYAVSLNTRRQDPTTWDLEVDRFLSPYQPIRLFFVPEANRKRCWTHLNIGGVASQSGADNISRNISCSDSLRFKLKVDPAGNDVDAQREYASLRLMAAFSYLIWAERISYAGRSKADMIQVEPKPPVLSVASIAQQPCDPRQVVLSASGAYVPNTYGGVGPWDVNRGAAVKAGGGMYGAGVFNGAVRAQTTRDGRWLAEWIKVREVTVRATIQEALRAAADAVETKVATAVQMILPAGAVASAGIVSAKSLITSGKLQVTTAAAGKAATKAACEAGGGYYEEATGYCKPTPATEAACRATNGTPYWDPINKYKCLPPGQAVPSGPTAGGSGVAGIALLAGAALLIAKFMK